MVALLKELLILMQETGLGKYSSLELEATVGKEVTAAVTSKQEGQKRTGRKEVEAVVPGECLAEQRTSPSGSKPIN